MDKITDLPYAKWLEVSLKSVIDTNTRSICIITRNDKGEIGSGYFDCSIADKLMFAGFIQQDAMMERLAVDGYLDDDEDDFDTDDTEEYCE